ncbi:hypothetical protein K457DRAFT_156105 [Linnemannia elongata AG-77]|uniref:BHLH domain-containing protein n=1 Tax=Linnemannia elongata AG-77 TaxID=1314771 RepID=A0A197JVF6_9FUNG|nr:hypothetical protein K457DRAFT_156105 [Linnemannia elongata AG-77]
MSNSTNSTLFGPDSSSSEVASSSVFEATQRAHFSTSPTSSSFASYRPQHSRQNSRDPAFSSDNNGNSFLPSLVSDPSSHQQSRSSSFSSTTSASTSTSYSERHDHHHPHFYHEQQKTSEPAAYGYQRNHSQHIYQAHANNSNNNYDAQQSPSSHLLPQSPAEPFALYSLNQHQHHHHHHHNNNNNSHHPHRDISFSQLLSSPPRRASKNGDGVFGGIMPDHNDDRQGIPLGSSSSRPIHSRQSSSASVTAAAASATIAHLHLNDHPPTSTSSSSPPPFNSSSHNNNINTAGSSSLFQSRHSPPSPHSPSFLFPSSSSSSHHQHPLSSSSAFLGPASSSSSSRSPQTPPLTPSPRKHDSSPPLQGHHHPQQYLGQQHHPAGGVGHRQAIGAGVRGGILGPVSSAAHAEKAMHKVLTHEPGCVKSRRLAHILSEQKRREKINGGFDELKSVIPDCAQNTDSKATILRKATAYILLLEEELKRYSDAYPRPSDDLTPPPPAPSSSHHQDYMHRQ